MDFKEILTASMILFAIIDIIGATPIVISLRKKVGKIESEKATLVSMIIMFMRGEHTLDQERATDTFPAM